MPSQSEKVANQKALARVRVLKALKNNQEPQATDHLLLGDTEIQTLRLQAQNKAEMPTILSQSPLYQEPLLLQSTSKSQSQSQSQGESHQSGPTKEYSQGESGNASKQKQPPLNAKQREWAEFYRTNFGPLVIFILWLFLGDLDKAVFYAPTPEECVAIAPYMARLSPKIEDLIKLPQVVHDTIINSNDAIAVGWIVIGYLDRVGILIKFIPWLKDKFTSVKETVSEQREYPGSDGPIPGSNGAGPDIDISTIAGIGAQYIPS
jgi:hypothetical protein